MRPLRRSAITSIAGAATAGAFFVCAAGPAQAAPLPVGTLGDSVAAFALHPDSVAGANDWSCKPTSEHPYPVVLLPGTFENIGFNFAELSPALKNAGYCVFATNYGMSWFSAGRIGGMNSETSSGNQVSAFINQVLASTGARKVDIVGHSQGGSMGINYIKLHGGATKVNTYVGWGQSSNGTTLSGIQTLGQKLSLLGLFDTGATLFGAPSLVDQQVGSAYTNQTTAIPLPSGPKYVTIQTENDEVVTPYATQSLPGAQNIVIQQSCPTDHVGHVGLNWDSPTLQLTLNALAGGPTNFTPQCSGFGPQYF